MIINVQPESYLVFHRHVKKLKKYSQNVKLPLLRRRSISKLFDEKIPTFYEFYKKYAKFDLDF